MAQMRRNATISELQKATVSDSTKTFRAALLIKTGRPSSGPSSLYPPGTVKAAAKVIVANKAATTDHELASDQWSTQSLKP